MKLYQSAWSDRRKSINVRQNRTEVIKKVAQKTMPKVYREVAIASGKK